MAVAVPVMVAEITKRAKGRGMPAADESDPKEPTKPEGDYDEIKRSAIEDLASALGLKNVDIDAAMTALSDFHEACYGEEKSETPKQEKDEDAGEEA
jgi:hypothetical protein